MVKVTYSGFHCRRDGISWLVMSTPIRVPVQPTQYLSPNCHSLPRLREHAQSDDVSYTLGFSEQVLKRAQLLFDHLYHAVKGRIQSGKHTVREVAQRPPEQSEGVG